MFAFLLCAGCSTQVPYLKEISALDLQKRGDENKFALILDVRSQEEYEKGHIKGAMNITHAELPYSIEEIEQYKSKEIVVYCRSGRRSGLAIKTLQDNGFMKILQLQGHIKNWKQNNFTLEVN